MSPRKSTVIDRVQRLVIPEDAFLRVNHLEPDAEGGKTVRKIEGIEAKIFMQFPRGEDPQTG